uniref:small monomeric GTPase n=3 Tax=Neoaves TaxID=3078114 RepID=A0A8C0B3V0_9AVES
MLLLPQWDFKCYKVIKKKEDVLIQQRKKAPQVKVNKKAQGAAARLVCVLQRLILVHIKDLYFFHCFTALVVRFLTKRFIGDYEANTGESAFYCSTADSLKRNLLICCQEQINRSIYWADGFVFVYSITDYESYRVIRPLHQHIRKIHPNANIPLLLMANKGDLLRARQVSSKEGLQLASELGGTYYEVSARENCEGVHEAFQQLCQEVSRMIGSCNGEKRRGLHLVRPKSPNMQDLKRRLKQALTSKGKSATTL